MGDITRFQEVLQKWRFKIVNSLGTLTLNTPPIGWDSLQLTLTRNETFNTLFRGFSADLEFIHDGYDNLTELENDDGIMSSSRLLIDKLDTHTAEYDRIASAPMDLSEYRQTDANGKGVNIPLIDNTFIDKLSNRKDIDIPFDRPTDLDDGSINAGIYTDIILKGREFGNADVLSNIYDEDLNNVYNSTSGDVGNPFTAYVLRIITPEVKLNPGMQDVYARSGKDIIDTPTLNVTSADCYFYNEVGTAIITPNLNLHYSYSIPASVVESSSLNIGVLRVTFKTDGSVDSYDFIKEYSAEDDTGALDIPNGIFEFNDSVILTDRQGLLLLVNAGAQGYLVSVESLFTIRNTTTLTTTYYSQFAPTPCKVVLPHELFTYLAAGITGEENAFRSNYYGRTDLGYDEDGEGAFLAVTNGMLIRQFEIGYIQEEGEDRKAQLAFMFKEAYENYFKQHDIGITVIEENGKDIIVAEPRIDIYNSSISKQFDEIQKGSFERVRNNKYSFSSIEAGYITDPDDLVGGLEEYNTKISHSTILSKVENTYDLVCTYSGITSRIERQRRKPAESTSTEELTGDKTIFFIECWRDEFGDIVQRETQGFDDVIGLDGLDTKLNLGITPKQIMLKHGRWITVGLVKDLTSVIKYNTSDKVTDLQLLKTGETVYIVENGDIVAGTLDNPIITGFDINFNGAVSIEDYFEAQENPNKLLGYPSPLTDTTNYGWIDVYGMEAVDRLTNVVLMEANPSDIATVKVLGNENGEVYATNKDKLIGIT